MKFLTVNMLNLNLREINLHKNQIKELPPEICKLRDLQILHIDHNLLESLPPKIGQLHYLEELILNDNHI